MATADALLARSKLNLAPVGARSGCPVSRHGGTLSLPAKLTARASDGRMSSSQGCPSERSGSAIETELEMRNEFTAVIERDGDWYIAYCPEIPGANGQGRTAEECRASLVEAIELILEDRREDALRGVPPDAIRETVVVR